MTKKLIVNLTLALVFFGFAGVTWADKPFIRISATPEQLVLEANPFPGVHGSSAVLTVEVESNCVHGPIVASLTPLKNKSGELIPPERVSIKTTDMDNFVPMKRPVVISEPTIGTHKVVLNFRVLTRLDNSAGRYTGTLVFTIMPP